MTDPCDEEAELRISKHYKHPTVYIEHCVGG